MTRQLSLLVLSLSVAAFLSGCGRGTADLYRAYNIVPTVDKAGKPIRDLASQNRISLQTSGEYSYFYVAPEQKDFANPGSAPSPAAAEASDEETTEVSDEEVSEEGFEEGSEASGEESGDEAAEEGSELEAKIDELSDAVEALGDED